MSGLIKFGTDGWRGKIAADYTFTNVRRCAQGFAAYLLAKGWQEQRVIVGYDRRFQSENFAIAASEVLAGNGLNVLLTDRPTPTPVIAFSIIHQKAVGAVNITASHNPPTDNGFKVRNEHGGAIDPEGLHDIEIRIPEREEEVVSIAYQEGLRSGKIVVFDASPDYIAHLNALVDIQGIKNAGLKVLVDPMWGNGAGWFSSLLAGGKTSVEEIHSERNPIFPEMSRPEPIPPNINVGLQEVLRRKADVLIITDGDADRIGIGDEHGVFIDQLRAFGLFAFYLLEVRNQRGPIVKTLSTTGMLDKLAKLYNVQVYETGVGFKYIAPKFLETNALIGGEESGGYAFRGNVPERDGILAGLYFLDMMVKLNRTPSELLDLLFSKVGPHYYDRIDTPFSGNRKEREERIVSADPERIGGLRVQGINAKDGYKFVLEDGGFLLIRFSGTEPILRVYTETTNPENVKAILNDGLRLAGIE
jgi:phosphomannomutase